MSKSAVAIIVVVLVALVGGGALLASNNSSKNKTSDTSMNNMPAKPNPSPANKTTDSTASTSNSVSIQNYAFSPATINVKKGTTVTWTNQDSVQHDVTSDNGTGPKSELLAKGKSYSYTFNDVGTFAYHCTPHPYMKATVIVTQ